MAVKFSIDAKRGETHNFDPELVEISDFTGRKFPPTAEQIKAKVDSFLKLGQLQPIGVRSNDDRVPVVIYGHCRLLAARYINAHNLTSSPFLIEATYYKVNAAQAVALALAENADETRIPHNCVDIADAIYYLKRVEKQTVAEIAKGLGKDPSEIAKYEKISELDSKTQREIVANGWGLSKALALYRVSSDKRDAVIQKAKQAAGGKRVTATALAKTAKAEGATKVPTPVSFADFKTIIRERRMQIRDNPTMEALYTGMQHYFSGTAEVGVVVDLLDKVEAICFAAWKEQEKRAKSTA